MFFTLTASIAFAVLVFIIALIVYGRWNYGILESLNIPVVKPSFLLGSTPDLHLRVTHFEDIKRFKKHGSIYGVYEGRTPQIHICDPQLIRQIFIKDFVHFYDRRNVDLGDPILNEVLDFIDVTFPFLTKFAPTLNSNASAQLAAIFQSVLQNRQNSSVSPNIKFNDLADKFNSMFDQIAGQEYKALGITGNTIDAQLVGVILAAYDAIVTTMVMFLYYVASNLDIEDKLIQEIDSFFKKHSSGQIEPDNLIDLVYLQACINETLRLVPPFIRPERICTKDWQYNSIKIPKRMIVMLPSWSYNRNPELFPDQPDEFKPDRFFQPDETRAKSKYSNISLSTFGMKLAIDSIKMCLVHLLYKFQFKLRPDTAVKYKNGVLFLIMYEPIYLDVSKRIKH